MGRPRCETLVPLRWIAGGDPVAITAQLPAWRGTLDWWVFADGQLGLAQLVLNGYPGDAWPTSGLQGEIHAEMRAIDRGFRHVVEPPGGRGRRVAARRRRRPSGVPSSPAVPRSVGRARRPVGRAGRASPSPAASAPASSGPP